MSFFGSIFTGSSPTINKAIPKAGQVSEYSTGLGEKLTTQSGDWLSSLLSGDSSKIGKLLAPQTSAARTAAQQGKQTLAQFGTRSGGTAGAASAIDAGTRGNILNMVAGLTGGAIGQAGAMGQSLMQTGLESLNMQVGFSQQQMENWANSILGKGLSSAASSAESFALSKIPGMPDSA